VEGWAAVRQIQQKAVIDAIETFQIQRRGTFPVIICSYLQSAEVVVLELYSQRAYSLEGFPRSLPCQCLQSEVWAALVVQAAL